MHAADYLIFLSYTALILALGLYHARRRQAYSEYFLAGRSMHWFPVGLSIMVTAFSAINYTGFSGEVFRHGSYVMLALPVFAAVYWPVARIIMPLFHAMQVGSAYEYLERRFDRRVRALASGVFMLWRLLWMATLIYVPCRVLAAITGVDARALTLMVGAVATLYTLAGGMRAVMWTDVLQFFVLVGGVLLGIGVAAARHAGGLTGLLAAGAAAGLARPFHPFTPDMFSLDPTLRITVWSCWLGTTVAFLARYGADQMLVQRYFSARSLRHARLGFVLNSVSAVFALLLLGVLGFAIHSHASAAGMLPSPAPPMLFFSAFVRSLPAGASGLIVAGLFAATMSSTDSGINSCAAALVTDFDGPWRRRGRPWLTDERLSRLATLAFGAAATLLALHVGRLGSVFEIANRVINSMGSPLLALFVMGLFSRRANARGALFGGAAGTLASTYICYAVEPLALHYYAALNLAATALLIYTGSLLAGPADRRAAARGQAWTWYGRAWLTPAATATRDRPVPPAAYG